jgi:ankyrin repeat protein
MYNDIALCSFISFSFSSRQTPLIAAARGGQEEVVRMLLRLSSVDASKDERDSLGRTALMVAAAAGHLNVTALLLNAGCDRTLRDTAGLSAKDHASRHSFTVMLQFSSQTMIR